MFQLKRQKSSFRFDADAVEASQHSDHAGNDHRRSWEGFFPCDEFPSSKCAFHHSSLGKAMCYLLILQMRNAARAQLCEVYSGMTCCRPVGASELHFLKQSQVGNILVFSSTQSPESPSRCPSEFSYLCVFPLKK